MSDSEDPIDPIEEDGDDLFGDEEDEAEDMVASPKQQILDDDDLTSDPDGETYPRHDHDDTQHQVETLRRIMEASAYRHPIPKPTDDTLRVLRVPKFIKFHPEEYQPDHFEPSEFDTSNAREEHPKHVARFRRDANTSRAHSNTNILRWSDGSLTISVGGEQYEITKKPLAPPPNKPYNELHDVHYYAASAEMTSNLLMTVGHIKEQYNIRPNKDVGDDALNLLAERMAKASKPTSGADMLIRTTVDPELQKRQAEQLEKERMKAQRKRENAQAKQEIGLGRSRSGGLSIGALEGGRRENGRKRGMPGSQKPKRRRPEYDSDDDLPQGVGRQEKYDMEDGFIVASDDEEMESGAEESDEEDFAEKESPRRKKRQRTEEPEEEEDASGDEIEAHAESSGRHRRRNVVDDDDDEE